MRWDQLLNEGVHCEWLNMNLQEYDGATKISTGAKRVKRYHL